jgi:hypothetical protein
MLLIETYLNGSKVRQHWHALCNTRDEADAKISWMKSMFGYHYDHMVREITDEEKSIHAKPQARIITEQKAEIEKWQAECLRISAR